jgi:hypothetical protein
LSGGRDPAIRERCIDENLVALNDQVNARTSGRCGRRPGCAEHSIDDLRPPAPQIREALANAERGRVTLVGG